MRIVVVSLFDGISCGQEAIKRAGLKVNRYIAYEINDKAIAVTQKNYPCTVQMGSVIKDRKWSEEKKMWLFKYPDFSNGIGTRKNTVLILIGGSPCQNFSKTRIDDPKICSGIKGDKSSLVRAFIKAKNTLNPDYFFFENVRMNKEDESFITRALNVDPILLNSSEFSAQERETILDGYSI